MNIELYNLNFMHPDYGTIFNADIDASFTANEMINNLLLAGFIQGSVEDFNLSLMGTPLEAEMPFRQLELLEDGVVVKISKQTKTVDTLNIYIKHPLSAKYIPFSASPTTTPEQLLQLLCYRGFLDMPLEDLTLYFKGVAIPKDQAFKANNIPSEAYLELKDRNALAADGVLRTVLLGLDSFQATTNQKLEEIIKQMPPPSTIPIDPQRSINPTAEMYQSIDTLLAQIRETGKLLPQKKIRIWSPVPLIFWIILITASLTLMLLYILDLL